MDNLKKDVQDNCQICNRIHSDSMLVPNLKALFFLYLIGTIELLRQLFYSLLNWFSNKQLSNDQRINHAEENGVIILTGASSGIGKALRSHLKRQAKHIILLLHPKEVHAAGDDDYITIDFASKEATETSCSNLITLLENSFSNLPILLVHVAGVYNPPCEKSSSVLSESTRSAMKTLTINTVMPCLLFDRLRHLLSGIVTIGSSSQKFAPRMLPSQCPLDVISSSKAIYPLSKALALFSIEAWSEATSKPVVVIHPGVVISNLYSTEKSIVGLMLRCVVSVVGWKPEGSADKVITVMEKSGIFNVLREETSNRRKVDSSESIYWSTVTMERESLPSHFPDLRGRVLIGKRLFLAALASK